MGSSGSLTGERSRSRARSHGGLPGGVVPAAGENLEVAGIPEPGQPPEEAMVLVRIVSDMEPFMGVNGRIYHLKAEDVVTLPEKNAGVLIDRNIALNIIPGK